MYAYHHWSLKTKYEVYIKCYTCKSKTFSPCFCGLISQCAMLYIKHFCYLCCKAKQHDYSTWDDSCLLSPTIIPTSDSTGFPHSVICDSLCNKKYRIPVWCSWTF